MTSRENKKEHPHEPAPNGGWGWMVVLGAALINTVNQALFSVFGLIFGETLKEMGNGKATGLTFVMAVSVCVTNFSGLLVGPLMKRLSVMIITIFGVTCVSAGMIISSFATEMWHIAVGYGIFTGLGLGLVASSTFLAISEFFTTKKNTAVGLAMAGTSTGQMIMPIFVGILLKNFGFSGTAFTLGCVSACGIVGALLFKPIFCCKQNKNDESDTNYDLEENNKTPAEKNNKLEMTKNETKALLIGETKEPIQQEKQRKEINGSVITSTESLPYPMQGSWLKAVVKSLDLHLLKDFGFIHISLGLGLGYVSSISFSTIFPMFLQDEVNFTMWETTTCMTALSAADILGRITFPEIFRKLKCHSSRIQFMIGGVVLAVFRYCLVSANTYKMVLTFSFFTGYFRAVTVINQNLVISEYVTRGELPSAVGLNMFVKGFFVIAVGEPLGMLKDAFDYDVCVNLLNLILVVVVVSWSIDMLLKRRSSRNKNQQVASATEKA